MKLEQNEDFGGVVASVMAGKIDRDEFSSWLKNRPDVKPASWIPVVSQAFGEHGPSEIASIVVAHQTAAAAQAKASRGGRRKAQCPVTASQFISGAHPIELRVGGATGPVVTATPMVFRVDRDGIDKNGIAYEGKTPYGTSFGFNAGQQVVLDVGGVPVRCQVSLNLIAVGSGEAERGDLSLLDRHFDRLEAAKQARRISRQAGSEPEDEDDDADVIASKVMQALGK